MKIIHGLTLIMISLLLLTVSLAFIDIRRGCTTVYFSDSWSDNDIKNDLTGPTCIELDLGYYIMLIFTLSIVFLLTLFFGVISYNIIQDRNSEGMINE